MYAQKSQFSVKFILVYTPINVGPGEITLHLHVYVHMYYKTCTQLLKVPNIISKIRGSKCANEEEFFPGLIERYALNFTKIQEIYSLSPKSHVDDVIIIPSDFLLLL